MDLVPSFASTLRFGNQSSYRGGYQPTIFDPCAGEGDAVAGLRHEWSNGDFKPRVVACEMEGERALALREQFGYLDRTHHGDCFRLDWRKDTAAVLFLNPPYDHDPEHGRLEHRFLLRFAPALIRGHGILLGLVPYYVLRTSAEFLARNFTDLRVWRLPAPHFKDFGQVLVQGRRSPIGLGPEPMRSRLETWAQDPESIPVLPEICPDPLVFEPDSVDEFDPKLRAMDLRGTVAGFKPWAEPGTGTDLGVDDLLGARFRTAMPPKPAHIALALSSGMFNGHRLEPDDPRHPPVLAKGVFERNLVQVGEKTNSEGDVTGTVEIEHPRLRLTILRLDDYTFHGLAPGVIPCGGDNPSAWNAADLIENYRGSLVELLRHQFPPLHDPVAANDQIELPELARRPFRIQHQAVQTALKLMARGQNPFLIAEVGTGKTTMALTTVAALSPRHHAGTVAQLGSKLPKIRRTLVLCPPHLLDSWRDEAAAVVPEARVQVVGSIRDLSIDAEIYVLSREVAKLGHRLRGVDSKCPRCGAATEKPAKTNASRRLRCAATTKTPTNRFAVLARAVAESIFDAAPSSALVRELVPYRLAAYFSSEPRDLNPARLRVLVSRVVDLLGDIYNRNYSYEGLNRIKAFARITGTESEIAAAIHDVVASAPNASFHHRRVYNTAADDLIAGVGTVDDPTAEALRLLKFLVENGTWVESQPCGEPLYQSIPSPRRYPLAKYIAKRCRGRFDAVIVDEAQEYSNRSSAQTHALHRLVGLGVPTIVLTGSLMGGYASSLFANFWSMSEPFRSEFERGDKTRFLDRYGYRKVLVEKADDGTVTERGATTDREIRRGAKRLGEAPGIMPTFLMRHLLPTSVVVHKSDLDTELPPRTETPIGIEPDDATDQNLVDEYRRLQDIVLDRIKEERFTDRSGKLLGTLLEIPSYLDRCTADVGEFVVKYPDSMGLPPIDRGVVFPAEYRTPKERWLITELRRRLEQDENVIVFLRHTGTPHLPNRLMRLVSEELSIDAVWLDAKKVGAAKRQKWIDAKVLKPGARILFVNPDAVRTGLNNLVTFSTAIWYELHYSALTYRQANGRIHRIRQKKPVSVLFPVYSGTAQELGLDLVARKVSASLQVDGLDIQAALEAAGASETETASLTTAMSLGEAVYQRLVAAA